MDVYETRRRNLARLIERRFEGSQLDFSRAVEISPSYVSRMLKKEGEPNRKAIGEAMARRIEAALGLKPNDLDESHSQQNVYRQAHLAIQSRAIMVPTIVKWEGLMQTELPSEFLVQMPDDSMAPAIPQGTLVWFERRTDARPPDYVLIVDDSGTPYIREYRERRPGHWEAHAADGSGHLPLDSVRDGLQAMPAMGDDLRGSCQVVGRLF